MERLIEFLREAVPYNHTLIAYCCIPCAYRVLYLSLKDIKH